jgi:hypothetical protein
MLTHLEIQIAGIELGDAHLAMEAHPDDRHIISCPGISAGLTTGGVRGGLRGRLGGLGRGVLGRGIVHAEPLM